MPTPNIFSLTASRKVVCPYDAERYALKPWEVDIGDIVYVADSSTWWFVIDTENLGSDLGYDKIASGGDVPIFSTLRATSTTDAGAGPVGSIITAGGIYAAKSVIASSFNGTRMLSEEEPSLYNTFVGWVPVSRTSAAYTTLLGYQALAALTGGYANTAIGVQALFRNTTGNYNLAIGVESLAHNLTGLNNTAVGGYDTLFSNTTGDSNDAFGYAAAYSNTTGSANTSIGTNSLYTNSTGSQNVAIGPNAGYGATTGNNTFAGFSSGFTASTGAGNSFFGRASGYYVTTGSDNVLIGKDVALNLTTGSDNIAIGADVTLPSATASNQVVIGGLLIYAGSGAATFAAPLSITGDTTPSTDNAYDFGTVSLRWRDGRFSRNLTVENNASVTGTVFSASGSFSSTTDAGVATGSIITAGGIYLAKSLIVGTTITKPGGTSPLISTNTAITSGAAAQIGTLTNAPLAGNPTSWVPINDNGTTRYIPAW